MVNVLTDNDNRAAAEVNLVAKKNALKPAAMNSVAFKFDTKARLNVQTMIDEDSLMERCIECGVDDYQVGIYLLRILSNELYSSKLTRM